MILGNKSEIFFGGWNTKPLNPTSIFTGGWYSSNVNITLELEPLILNLIVKQIGRNDVNIDLDKLDLNLFLISDIIVKIKSEFATFLDQDDPRDIRKHVDISKTNIIYQNVSGEKSKDWNFGVW
jgi:hypothetical protein